MKTKTALLSLLAITSIAACLWLSNESETGAMIPASLASGSPTGNAATQNEEIVWSNKTQWLDQAVAGKRVDFVHADKSNDGKRTKIEGMPPIIPLGHLSGMDESRARGILDGYLKGRRDRLRSFQETMDSSKSEDLLREAELLRDEARAEACHIALASKSYFVERGALRSFDVKDAHLMQMTANKDTNPVVLTIVLKHEDHPQLPQLDDYWEGTRTAHLAVVTQEWNTMDIASRQVLTARLDKIKRAEKPTVEQRAFVAKQFPRGINFDRGLMRFSLL